MCAIKLASVSTAAVVVVLATSSVVLGQEDVAEKRQRYLYGEVEGFFHHDMDNPLGCDIGFTSEETGRGTSTLLGATTVESHNCYVPTDTYQNMTHGVITITGENGDTLELEERIGNCLPDDVPTPGGLYSCVIVSTITAGSGGLEGASGEVIALAYITNVQSDHPDAAPGDVTMRMIFEGLVDY